MRGSGRVDSVRRGLASAGALALLLLTAAPALSTTVLRFSLDELVERADLVVHGTCSDVQGRETPDGVVTDVTIRVSRALKGDAAETLRFTTYGGATETRGTFIAGSPQFEKGEELVVFLDRPTRVGYRLAIGMSQGKYTVHEDAAGRKVATRNLAGLRFVDPRTGEVEEAGPEQGVALDELLRTIEAAVNRSNR
jgi:hypothetical protein